MKRGAEAIEGGDELATDDKDALLSDLRLSKTLDGLILRIDPNA